MKMESNLMSHLVLLLLFCFSCKSEVNIENFSHRELKYTQLPVEIKILIRDISEGENNLIDNNLIVLGETTNYELEVVKTGPWVAHSLLHKKGQNSAIKIPRGFPHPYIIYNNRLYFPTNYNIISRNNYENIISSSYLEYMLE
ncbi:hypothetical protein [Chryseobacterium sp.]|uniref:hypothetical protein n=1 Tax=Chryseobacterium sp. TaxID=1871047 RepID=UPI0012A9AD4B|nr:hypothetical protein [Chryseobacterium sp.]QFG53240.1 hypothetical protein F7R58_06660 [Chryseobacterium sp.]